MRAVVVLGLLFSFSSVAEALTPKEVFKKAGPAVVLILGSDDGRSGSGGTGSIVTGEGKVITNAHVVLNDHGQPYKILYVFLKPPKITGDNSKDLVNRYKARVLAFSPADELDLALLQIDSAPAALPTIAFADPNEVEIGDQVVAIGHPEQGGLWTLTTGAISTMIANFNRVSGKDVFQTEASVNRGNSGGPLLDDDGNMVGINTMIARQGAGGIAITDVNFSLKSSVAVSWMAGQGMGLAYRARAKKEELVVAVAAEPTKPAAAAAGESAPSEATPTATSVKTAPPSTIVVAEKPPAEPQKVRSEAADLGKGQEEQQVVAGQPLDPNKAKPKYHTEKRPYSIDELRKQQMKELEDMMDEMRGKVQEKKSEKGMGLW